MIDSNLISVIIQGPIFHERVPGCGEKEWTEYCIESIRSLLPEAEIVLSTWEGSDVSKLDCDVCIFSEDPGVFVIEEIGFKSNINRQLQCTLEGLKHSTRLYALKMRTDSFLESLKFIELYELNVGRNPQYSIFSNRVVASCYVNADVTSWPFWVSDTYFFGKTNDLLDYWNVPFANEKSFREGAIGLSTRVNYKDSFFSVSLNKCPVGSNEQYYCREWVKKNFHKIQACKDMNMIKASNAIVADNFVLMDCWNSYGIRTLKYPNAKRTKNILGFEQWKVLCKRYSDNRIYVSWRQKIYFNLFTYMNKLKYIGIDYIRVQHSGLYDWGRKICRIIGYKSKRQ